MTSIVWPKTKLVSLHARFRGENGGKMIEDCRNVASQISHLASTVADWDQLNLIIVNRSTHKM